MTHTNRNYALNTCTNFNDLPYQSYICTSYAVKLVHCMCTCPILDPPLHTYTVVSTEIARRGLTLIEGSRPREMRASHCSFRMRWNVSSVCSLFTS